MKYKKHKGFALIEVMVAALILTVGAIGFLKLQTIALKSSRNNFSRGQGVEIAGSQIDFFRQNRLALQRAISDSVPLNQLAFPPIISVSSPTSPPSEAIDIDCQSHGTVEEGMFSVDCDNSLRNYQRYLLELKLAENFAPGMAIICTRFAGTMRSPIVRVDLIWRDNATYSSVNAAPNLTPLTINDCPRAINNLVNNRPANTSIDIQQLQATEKSVTVYGRL